MKWIILVYLFMCFTFVGCSSSSSDQSHSHSHTHDNNDNSSDNDTSDDSHYENDESTSVNMDITLSKALLTTEDGNDAARKHIENARWLGLSPNQQAIRTLSKTSEDESNLKKIRKSKSIIKGKR